jgi:hypothetical protein
MCGVVWCGVVCVYVRCGLCIIVTEYYYGAHHAYSEQLRQPNIRLVGLVAAQARHLMTHHGQFDVTLAIARGYGLDTPDNWTTTVYQQAVLRGNVPFVRRMQALGLRARPLLGELVALYRRDRSATSQAQLGARKANMQFLLRELVDDIVALHDYCVALEFKVMAQYCRQSRALQYLRPEQNQQPQHADNKK